LGQSAEPAASAQRAGNRARVRNILRKNTRHTSEVITAQKTLHQQWLHLPHSDAVECSIEPLLDAIRAGRPQYAARALLDR
jgi:hypothetical protein